MKKDIKKLIKPALLGIAFLSLSIGATYALMSSSDSSEITIGVGNVSYSIGISDLSVYTPKSLDTAGSVVDSDNIASMSDSSVGNFGLGGSVTWSDGDLIITNMMPGDEVSFTITVSNSSTVDSKWVLYAEGYDSDDERVTNDILPNGLALYYKDVTAEEEYFTQVDETDYTDDAYDGRAYFPLSWVSAAAVTTKTTVRTIQFELKAYADVLVSAGKLSFTLEAVQSNVSTTIPTINECVLPGTKIALADGSEKNVEDLVIGDVLKAVSFLDGGLVDADLLYVLKGHSNHPIITVGLSNGSSVSYVTEEMVYDMESYSWVNIDSHNYADVLGMKVAVLEEGEVVEATIVSTSMRLEETDCYTVITSETLNYFANGVLSTYNEPFLNFYEKEGLSYDFEAFDALISEYGLFDYSVFAEWVSEDLFVAFRFTYLSIPYGMGLCDMGDLEQTARHAKAEYEKAIAWMESR